MKHVQSSDKSVSQLYNHGVSFAFLFKCFKIKFLFYHLPWMCYSCTYYLNMMMRLGISVVWSRSESSNMKVNLYVIDIIQSQIRTTQCKHVDNM